MNHEGRRLLVAMAGSLMIVAPAAARAETPPASAEELRTHSIPSSLSVGFERLRLDQGEHLGLLGANYLLELSPGWWLGPAFYGAATGQRGGLFTWGAEGQRRWLVGQRWGLVTGVYVGGGGGAAAPVGGGLMLRPHVDLMFDWGTWAAGLSASQVRFPSGSIRSSQLGIVVAVNDEFRFAAPGHSGAPARFDGSGGLGLDHISLTGGRYRAGGGALGSLTYVGVRVARDMAEPLEATFEANGAASGGADGYAEVTAGLLGLWPVFGESARMGAHVVLGLAGGGAVPTGGGPIAKASLAARFQFGRTWSLDAEVGRARAFRGGFDTNYAQLSLGMSLGVPDYSGGTYARRSLHDSEWSLSVQDYLRAQRKDGTTRSLSAIGLKFQRSLGEHFYATGQAHSAITGGAGAYSAGLVGLGVSSRIPFAEAWRFGAEAAVGAGGGGGVASSGGAIMQPMAWVGRDFGTYSRVKIAAGVVKSLRGELSSPVVELSWSMAFGVP